MQTYHGSCHCGTVRFEVAADLSNLVECNCSICRKKGALHHSVPRERFRLLSGRDTLRLYQFNKMIAKHYFCATCGIHTFSHPRTAPEEFNVNIRCLDDFDPRSEPHDVSLFDGRNWEAAFAARQTASED